MDDATATSLGEKLGGLDLTEGEQVLLAVLLGGTPDADEVEGFSQWIPGGDQFSIPGGDQFSLNFEEIKVTYRPIVGNNIGVKGWSWGESISG